MWLFLAGRRCNQKRQQRSKSIMGSSLVMLSLTSVKAAPWPGKRTRSRRQPLICGSFSFLGVSEVRQFGVFQKTGLCGPWCSLGLTQKWWPEVDGVCWQLKPGLEFLPNCYHGDVCTREREPGRDLPRPLDSRNVSNKLALEEECQHLCSWCVECFLVIVTVSCNLNNFIFFRLSRSEIIFPNTTLR